MRLDHIAYRVSDREKTVKFFVDAFGYTVQTEGFEPIFSDGTSQGVKCTVLAPPEKLEGAPWQCFLVDDKVIPPWLDKVEYHTPPELFISSGPAESIVGKWVAARDGIGGIHHLAYQVDNVQVKMDEWKEKGYAEFLSQEPLTCPGLTQVFTRPSELTGVIFEFINRGKDGFCAENVAGLMESTKEL